MSAAPQLTPEQRQELEEKLRQMSPEELREFQKKQCIFCQIITGKVPSKKIYEDEKAIALLDINPATKGHVLLLPKEHYAIMPQIPEVEIGHLFSVSKKISQAILRGLKVSGTSLFVANGLAAGQRAQHFMIHILPRREGDNLLHLEEKFIDQQLQQKVITAVENQLNELLDVKKKVVAVHETPTEAESPEETSLDKTGDESEDDDTTEHQDKGFREENLEAPEEKEEQDEPEEYELVEKSSSKKSKPGTRKKQSKKVQQRKPSKETEKESEGNEEDTTDEDAPHRKLSDNDVTLDDIANLFK